jgi:hypothetical protein
MASGVPTLPSIRGDAAPATLETGGRGSNAGFIAGAQPASAARAASVAGKHRFTCNILQDRPGFGLRDG